LVRFICQNKESFDECFYAEDGILFEGVVDGCLARDVFLVHVHVA